MMIARMYMFLITAALALPAIGFSQWLHYPTAGVPAKADGSRDLTAPAPIAPLALCLPSLTHAF